MKYVFRTLSKNIKESKFQDSKGNHFYKIPLVIREDSGEITKEVNLPANKTFTMNNHLYFILDSEKENPIIANSKDTSDLYSERDLLNIINHDYIKYLLNKIANRSLPHAINSFIPCGTYVYDNNNEKYTINKWHSTANKISKIYPMDLVAIDPIYLDSIYPFIYRKFSEDEYIKEYRANVIMFTLDYDNNFKLDNDHTYQGSKFIYYNYRDKLIPIYRLINEQNYYETCELKDARNNATTPFLKAFNDKGMCRELVQFYFEDDNARTQLMSKYKALRDEVKINRNSKEIFFIPALSGKAYHIQEQIQNNNYSNYEGIEYYRAECEKRMEKLLEMYEKNKIFYFTYDEISQDKFFINSALQNYQYLPKDDVYFNEDKNLVYTIEENSIRSYSYPILEVINKEQMEKLKEEIYKKWLINKKNSSRKF